MDTTPNPAKAIKAFGYLRVSGESQIEGDGFPRQRAAIQKYAAAHGIEIVRFFEERGVSGTTEGDDRPAFQEMLVALLSNGTRMVLIERLDRIARDIIIQEGIIKNLTRRGFELVSVSEPDLCSDDMYRVAMRQMLGVFSELDRKAIVVKLRAARNRKKLTNGKCEGRKPFGHYQDEAQARDRIVNLYSSSGKYDHVAKTLNAEGIKTRSGGEWYPATVRRIILYKAPSTKFKEVA
jgi:DNA invertase Pin-like site-specific DNA recombinase